MSSNANNSPDLLGSLMNVPGLLKVSIERKA